jgi:hypothetical protein
MRHLLQFRFRFPTQTRLHSYEQRACVLIATADELRPGAAVRLQFFQRVESCRRPSSVRRVYDVHYVDIQVVQTLQCGTWSDKVARSK